MKCKNHECKREFDPQTEDQEMCGECEEAKQEVR